MGNFKCTVLKVLSSTEPDKNGNRVDLRIVKWGDNGKPVLEKRRMWRDEDNDEERVKKMMGLGPHDIKIVLENIDEVMGLLEGES